MVLPEWQKQLTWLDCALLGNAIVSSPKMETSGNVYMRSVFCLPNILAGDERFNQILVGASEELLTVLCRISICGTDNERS